jgi:aconitase B
VLLTLPNAFMQPDVPLHAVAELAQQAQEDASATDEDAEEHARMEVEVDAGNGGASSSAAPPAASPRRAPAARSVSTCVVRQA